MGCHSIGDFNLDSEGHCFFCLKEILAKVKQEHNHNGLLATPQIQKHSAHYLSRYLEMDIGKVFNDTGQIDSSLLAEVRRSRLKVELCEKCTSLNKTFSRVYRQLEKLELEIRSSLGLINEELLAGYRSDKPEAKHLYKSMRNELSEIVGVLREEAMQKCSQKLRGLLPRVGIKKLPKKQIHTEVSKHQTKSENAKMKPETLYIDENIKFEKNFKTEAVHLINAESVSDDDDDNTNYDSDMDNIATRNFANTKTTEDPRAGANDKNSGTHVRLSNKSLVTILAKTLPVNRAGIGKDRISINLGNGRWKCSACPLELASRSGINYHYKRVHCKIRYKCVPCGKDFAQQSHYHRHHQSVHAGVKFQCLVCSKLFQRKDKLREHQRATDCRKATG